MRGARTALIALALGAVLGGAACSDAVGDGEPAAAPSGPPAAPPSAPPTAPALPSPPGTAEEPASRSWPSPRPPDPDELALLDGPLPSGVPQPSEVQLQRWLDDGLLPIAPAWSETIEQITTNLLRGPRPDVVVLGDSITQQAVDPARLAQRASAQEGRPVVAYDLATTAAKWRINRLMVDLLWRTGRLPRVAVVGLSAFASGEDAGWNGEARGTPLGAVLGGCADVPDRRRCERWRSDLTARYTGRPDLWREAASGRGVLRDSIDGRRYVLRRDGLRYGPPGTARSVGADVAARVRRGGGQPIRASTAAREQLGGIVELLRAHGTTAVAVGVPFTPPLMAAYRSREPDYEPARRRVLSQLAAHVGVPYIHVADAGPWWTPRHAHDANHLTLSGARRFTDQLWADAAFRDVLSTGLDAPWPTGPSATELAADAAAGVPLPAYARPPD